MSRTLFVTVCAALVACALATTCENPKVDLTYFTTGDATIVSQIGFIGEFTLDCADSSATGLPLYALVEGRITPVARIGSNKYQVSWTQDPKEASRGSHPVLLFDEEGFGAVRKAQRSGNAVEDVPELSKIDIYHAGAFNGPWVNSEILAAVLAVGIAYVAFSSKSKLLA